jgi:hypothetical protein
MFFIVAPTARKMQSGQIVQSILVHSRFNTFIGASGGLTVLAGLLLYGRVYSSDWLSTGPGIVLTIGALAGIAALIHGGAVLSRLQREYVSIAKEVEAAGGPPSQAQLASMMDLQAKIAQHSQISVALLVISVLGMASARYL